MLLDFLALSETFGSFHKVMPNIIEKNLYHQNWLESVQACLKLLNLFKKIANCPKLSYLVCSYIFLISASIKDGYAVISGDKAGLRKVIGASNAGNKPEDQKLQPGICVRINTGAPVPPG